MDFLRGRGAAVAHLQRATGEVHPGQVTSPSQANNHSHLRAIETNSLNSHVFGRWEEAGVPRGNPHMHRENMQTPCRKTPGPELNPGPSYCKATVLPPAPLQP
ncbi:hypothetical protein ILYODFUR_004559 [Ilyodon furcidens]|uniref:Uncharacterized protein n=1 Tax=Ilyodon furcidens TaxID=33524 RepID=A0ABV0TUJ8_9TELE